jgi:hypothetical protein
MDGLIQLIMDTVRPAEDFFDGTPTAEELASDGRP